MTERDCHAPLAVLRPESLAADSLPKRRLAYVGDVPVARTVAGPLLLYRLLSDEDPDRLLVIGSNADFAPPDVRIPGVEYRRIGYVPMRLMRSRFVGASSRVLVDASPLLAGRVCRMLKRWRAESVLTVAHGYLWRAAVAAARTLGLPVHLIVHDDWPTMTAPITSAPHYQTVFGRELRRATTLLCVSPYMAEAYERDYGVPGITLYPSRGRDSPEACLRVRAASAEPLTVAYVGSLWGGQYVELINAMANLLAERGGRLDLYSKLDESQRAAFGLVAPNIRICGFLSPYELAQRIGATADAVFVPMSFLPHDRTTAALAFPSKLVEYTAFGVPLLIWGPSYCSAVRWANENPGVALTATTFDSSAMRPHIERLATEPELRQRLAGHALTAGNRDFSLEAGRRLLRQAIAQA